MLRRVARLGGLLTRGASYSNLCLSRRVRSPVDELPASWVVSAIWRIDPKELTVEIIPSVKRIVRIRHQGSSVRFGSDDHRPTSCPCGFARGLPVQCTVMPCP